MNVPTTLPFFNGTRKQASNRDGSPCVIFSPRTQLPPFLIQRPHVADDWVDDIFLVDCEGNETDIADYFRNSEELITGGYLNGAAGLETMNTLTINANDRDITQALKTTTGAGDAGFDGFDSFSVTDEERFYFEIDLLIGSGVAPKVYISDGSDVAISNEVLLVAGVNKIILTADATEATATILFYNDTADQANYAATVTLIRTNRPEVHEFTSIDYIQYNGKSLVKNLSIVQEEDWDNGSPAYDTLTNTGTAITSAINLAGNALAEMPDIPGDMTLFSGAKYIVFIRDVVINSGQEPSFGLNTSSLTSGTTQVSAGNNVLELTIVDDLPGQSESNGYLQVVNSAAANWECGEIDIFEASDYLPRGTYYIKLIDGTNEWFSEWFNIQDVYSNLASSLVNSGGDPYDTFESSGTKILSAINTAGATIAYSDDSGEDIANDEVITVAFFITLNSGQLPSFTLTNSATEGAKSDSVQASEGINEINLTATEAISGVRLRIVNTGVSNFSTSEIWVSRTYSPRFVKLQFSDTKDLHGKRNDDQTILYQEGFVQECWLNTILNTPEGNRIDEGEEKNGVFIPEKIITQYKYKIIDYINRSLFEGLIRLPQHDSLTIIDEVGNEYTPDTGNIELSIDWTTFDTGTVTILFNDGSFVRTENSEDIT